MKFSPEILACHAQFGGDLEDMQRRYNGAKAMTAPLQDDALVAALKLRVASWKRAKDDEVLPVPLGTLRALVAALAASQAPAPADEGKGWVTVPTFVSVEMDKAGRAALREFEEMQEDNNGRILDVPHWAVWRAMIEAAPSKESGHEG